MAAGTQSPMALVSLFVLSFVLSFVLVSHQIRRHSRFVFDDCLDLMMFSNHYRREMMAGWLRND